MDTVALLTYAQTSYLIGAIPQLLSTVTLGSTAASVTYNVVTPYPRIQVIYGGATTAGSATNLLLRFNGVSTSSYVWQYLRGVNTTVSAVNSAGTDTSIQIGVLSSNATANYAGSGNFIVEGVNQSSHFPTAHGVFTTFTASNNSYIQVSGGQYNALGPVTSLTLSPGTGSFMAGSSFSFYGLS